MCQGIANTSKFISKFFRGPAILSKTKLTSSPAVLPEGCPFPAEIGKSVMATPLELLLDNICKILTSVSPTVSPWLPHFLHLSHIPHLLLTSLTFSLFLYFLVFFTSPNLMNLPPPPLVHLSW
jgi:hypothetical protein